MAWQGIGSRPREGAPLGPRAHRVLGALWYAVFAGLETPALALTRARAKLFLWMPVALSLGIGAYFSARSEPSVPLYACVGMAGLLALWVWLRGVEWARFPAAILVLACAGFVLAGWRAHAVAAPVLSYRYYGPVEGRVIGIDRAASDKLRITLDQVRIDARIQPKRVRIALGDMDDSDVPPPGSFVMTTAHLMPPPPPAAPDAYDFGRAAWFNGLGAIGYTSVPVMRFAPPAKRDLGLSAHRARRALSQAIQARISGQPGAMAAAILTGDRSGLSEATREDMRRSNLAHLIAISGLHMGLLAGFVFALVRYGLALWGKRALVWPVKKIAAIVALLAATGYLWLSGAAVSTQRAWIMVTVMLLAVLIDRRALSLRTVALAATLLLIWRPESLIAPGFQMSFAATTALIVALGPWAKVARRIPRLLRPLAMLIATSVIAGAATAPIVAAQFHRVSEYGVFANLLAVPAMGMVVMPAGVIAAILALVGLSAPALWVMGLGTRWILAVAQYFATIEGAVVPVVDPGPWVIPLLVLGALGAVLARGAGRSLAILLMGLSVFFWLNAPARRPAILIAPEGELVGLMTPQGRALSKSAAKFVGARWLEADGDMASPQKGAKRAGFAGPNSARVAEITGRKLIHLSGKSAQFNLAALCHDNALIVINARVKTAPPGCDLWDQTRLKRTGAVALTREGELVDQTRPGARLWTP
ncbi:ComEC/Rec2 family competence protein [Thioclava indica]|uniref:ComEC/Rec2-related protein domain-containing protein n=1 Tax=Thioclava indica TaxID=1353528 RepID=A0A074JVI5_9RHOB|nr:ComEC/Rec2 family competence protein [Thioclava indica]KEO61681.1 hypothetical protein DT23_01545 [Thioclava indica]